MSRILNGVVLSLPVCRETIGLLPVNASSRVQIVRWRKPINLPKAPSKLYKITCRKKHPPEEIAEVLRLYNNYRNAMFSIRTHLVAEYEQKSETAEFAQRVAEEEQIEHKRLMQFNDEWNKQLANEREARAKQRLEDDLKRVKETKRAVLLYQDVRKKEALQLLENTKELVKTFIPRESLEEAIQGAINNPVDYNFSIDLEGRIYKGRRTLPHHVEPESLKQMEVVDNGFSNSI